MSIENLKKIKRTLADWKNRRPRETPEREVIRLLEQLEFEFKPMKGSHLRAYHSLLKGYRIRDFGIDGGVTIVPHHTKRCVSWFDLRDVISAAEAVIEQVEDSANSEGDGS